MTKSSQASAVNEMYSHDSSFGQDVPKPQPGEVPPCADFHGLRELGAMEFFPRRWGYGHKQHSLRDLMTPGYFKDEARDFLNIGDEIYYTMCCGESKDPAKWDRGICVVLEKSSRREEPVILGGTFRFSKPTSWAGATAQERSVGTS